MKLPPFMFAAIIVVILAIFLLTLTFWNVIFPDFHLTSNPNNP